MSEWKVWYQAKDGLSKYSSGSLTIGPGLARYAGKNESFTIDNASTIERKMAGTKTWIHVAYDAAGEPRDAFFLDRRMLGWSGMLGGNDKLLAELQEALRPAS